jgi:SAM-dependent methyltransferase
MNFSEFYANSYNKIHASKIYAEEANQIIAFIQKQFPNSKNLKILDFGCGTGVHLAELVNDAFELTGYDRNEHMLKVAKENFPTLNLTSDHSVIQSDMDLIYSIFDVTSYQVTSRDLEEFFSLIASKLRSGGIVAVDGWHYLGVKLDPPQSRERSFEMDGVKILRRVEPSTVDGYRTTTLSISLVIEDTGQVMVSEVHEMKAFEEEEISAIATKVGFRNLQFKDGENWTRNLGENSWRFMMSAEYYPT